MNETRHFVARVLDNGIDAVATIAPDFRIEYWNDAMTELSGISHADAIGRSVFDVFPELHGSAAARVLDAALCGRYTCADTPFFGARDTGQAAAHEWFAAPLWEGAGANSAVFIARPRAFRGQLSARLAAVEQRFRAMADGSPVLLWMSGPDGLCTFFNSTWLAFAGRTLDEELGVGWAENVHVEDFQRCMETYMHAFRRREPFEMEYRLRRFDGVYRWVLDRGVPQLTESGEFLGFIGSCVDIDDRKRMEQRNAQLSVELARMGAHMERLLEAACHELREPVRMVGIFLERLESRIGHLLDDKGRRDRDYAAEGAERMRILSHGLRELARVRNTTLSLERIAIHEVIDDVKARFAELIERTEAAIEVSTLPVVRVDRRLATRMFEEIVGNSLKFAGDAPPNVRIFAERSYNHWIITIEDRGLGFTFEDAERIFDMLVRLEERHRYPGSGLGLTIAREIALRHGGRVWAQPFDAPRPGACICVALPVDEAVQGAI